MINKSIDLIYHFSCFDDVLDTHILMLSGSSNLTSGTIEPVVGLCSKTNLIGGTKNPIDLRGRDLSIVKLTIE